MEKKTITETDNSIDSAQTECFLPRFFHPKEGASDVQRESLPERGKLLFSLFRGQIGGSPQVSPALPPTGALPSMAALYQGLFFLISIGKNHFPPMTERIKVPTILRTIDPLTFFPIPAPIPLVTLWAT